MYRRLGGNLRMWTVSTSAYASKLPTGRSTNRRRPQGQNEKQGLSLAKKSACVELEVGSPEYSVVHAIQDTRERLQITQTELARRTGIDQGDISKLERGTRNPSLKLLKRLAHGLGMELKIYP